MLVMCGSHYLICILIPNGNSSQQKILARLFPSLRPLRSFATSASINEVWTKSVDAGRPRNLHRVDP